VVWPSPAFTACVLDLAGWRAVRQDVGVASLPEPPAPDRPLFVYGLLKPRELAYPRIEEYVSEMSAGTIRGCLRLRDGLPLLDPAGPGEVSGCLLRFDPLRSQEAWDAVGNFEPDKHYKYDTTDVATAGERLQANVLVGRQIDRGTTSEAVDCWSAVSDPAFVEGLAEVSALTIETAPAGIASQPNGPNFWRVFFRLQAAYLLLWSVVERYTALRYGPGLDPAKRIKQLDAEHAFLTAVIKVGAVGSQVYDARDPAHKVVIRADGSRAGDYFYRVRSNLSHRGKSAFRDGQLVLNALVQLHDAMRILLAQQVPTLADKWRRPEPEGPEGWLLRPRIAHDAHSTCTSAHSGTCMNERAHT
jgi:hypothetical protein